MTDSQNRVAGEASRDPNPSVGLMFQRAFGDNGHRPAEEYGPVKLSIQGSDTHYSEPRQWLDNLSAYESVEVGFLLKGEGLTYPSKAGIEGFDHMFEQGMNSPVAGYVPLAEVNALRAAIQEKYGDA